MAITLDGSNGITTDIASKESATFNRDTTDGELIILQKDNSTVGSIGTKSGDLGIGTDDTGLRFYDAGNAVLPYNPSTQASPANTVDLGDSGSTFKDLYLSGGVYLGGTGAANYLDDYEEGTWTAGCGDQNLTGSYTKIGNQVIARLEIVTPSSSTSFSTITGLPFTPSEYGGGFTGRARYIDTIDGNGYPIAINVTSGSTTVSFRSRPAGSGDDSPHSMALTVNTYAAFVFVYQTSA